MNLPLKLRETTGYCTPKGPAIGQAKTVCFTLDGCAIEFLAPRHKSSYPTRIERRPEHRYKLAEEYFETYPAVMDRWRFFPVFFRSWGFYGPWFTGRQAELSFYIEVVRQAIPRDAVSFFHPRAFENIIADFLTVQYDESKDSNETLWIAPVNWKVIASLPCVAAQLDVIPTSEHYFGETTKHVFFPIGDQYLIHFGAKPHLFGDGNMEERAKHVNPAPMETLYKDIIASLKVTLSPEAQAQQAKALEGLTDTSLTPTFPPLKWGEDVGSQSASYQQLQNS